MTVKELKEKLKDFPEDLTVIIDTDDWSFDGDIDMKVSTIKVYGGLNKGTVKYESALVIQL